MQIGPYQLDNKLVLAPMAGVTDRPFRMLCRRLGAGMAVSEMVTANRQLWHTEKTRLRLDHSGESLPRSVQIAGTNPLQMSEAARYNIDHGAQIIDINMGCPAKKVCNVAAGSALMQNEKLVAQICTAVVASTSAPVTLKIRTGWNHEHRNAVQIARIAEDSGIQALTIHGRTRADQYRGDAEYDTIAAVKQAITIPVIANGDIDSPQKALQVLQHTAADGLMIGRAAQGKPWIFKQIQHYLTFGTELAEPAADTIGSYLIEHLEALYNFYGDLKGSRIARKHIGWYCNHYAGARVFLKGINRIEDTRLQINMVRDFFNDLHNKNPDTPRSKVA